MWSGKERHRDQHSKAGNHQTACGTARLGHGGLFSSQSLGRGRKQRWLLAGWHILHRYFLCQKWKLFEVSAERSYLHFRHTTHSLEKGKDGLEESPHLEARNYFECYYDRQSRAQRMQAEVWPWWGWILAYRWAESKAGSWGRDLLTVKVRASLRVCVA